MNVGVNEIRSVGGGSKSKLWREIKSAVTGKKIETLKESETACLGSAIFAGVGAGFYASVESAAESIVCLKDVCVSENEAYASLYKTYKDKESKLLAVY